jgi:hypothetical protein
MTLKTQIRRTLMSFAVIAAFAGVALAQGDAIAVPGDGFVLTERCADATLPAPVDAVEVAPTVVRVDWRVRVPATISRSRS